MSINNENLRNVAQAALDIMEGKIKHPNQQKLDVHEPEKDELTAKDFEKLRAMKKEDVEQIQEYESKQGRYVHKGTYGYQGKGAEHGSTDYDKANDDEKKEAKSNRRKYGARQNFVRSNRVNETFSGLLSVYKDGGLKSLSEALVKEEPTNAEFTAELDKAKAKADGTAKQADVAKPAVQAVQNEETHTEVEVIDLNDVNGVKISTIDLEERTLSEPEMNKREDVVKSMKKNMAGFKERYGKDAKSVMYATATKIAKKD